MLVKSSKKKSSVIIGTHEVTISNSGKIFWKEEIITKGELIEYYQEICPIILPYIKNRPQSLHRFPDGISGKSFYQKDVSHLNLPKWIKTKNIHASSSEKSTKYLVCDNCESVIYMINLGCIEIHPWSSKIDHLNYPDWITIDLDPFDVSFRTVVTVAIELNKLLTELKIKSFCKTSGASGMHIYIPLHQSLNYEEAKKTAYHYAMLLHEKFPDITSLERIPAKRKGKVYLDYLQNNKGQTLAAPYSVRPFPNAPVSAPLYWDEIDDNLDKNQFTIKTMLNRINKTGDVWKDFFNTKNS